jgi:hypothetical protein
VLSSPCGFNPSAERGPSDSESPKDAVYTSERQVALAAFGASDIGPMQSCAVSQRLA